MAWMILFTAILLIILMATVFALRMVRNRDLGAYIAIILISIILCASVTAIYYVLFPENPITPSNGNDPVINIDEKIGKDSNTTENILNMSVRNHSYIEQTGDRAWKDVVYADLDDTLEFQLFFKNQSGEKLTDITAKVVLAENIEIIEDSVNLYNANNLNGVSIDNKSIQEGTVIGSYNNEEDAYIRFKAKVVDKKLTNAINVLNIGGIISIGETDIQHHASVWVDKESDQVVKTSWSPEESVSNYGVSMFSESVIAKLTDVPYYFDKRTEFEASDTLRLYIRNRSLERVWSKEVVSDLGNILQIKVEYRNTTDDTQKNVCLIVLPSGNMEVIPGTTKLYNSNHKDGITLESNPTNYINIGGYMPGASAALTFEMRVVDKDLGWPGANVLRTWMQVYEGDVMNQDCVDVFVYKNEGVTNLVDLMKE